MRNVTFKLLVSMFLFAHFGEAFAIVAVQLSAGQRQSDFKSDDNSESIKAKEVQTSLAFDPIPLVPVSFGFFYLMHDYDISKNGKVFSFDELKGNQLGAEVQAWLPLKPTDFSLFVKAGYSFWGQYNAAIKDIQVDVEGNTSDYKVKLKSTGTKMGLGVKWSPIAFISGLLQVDYAKDSLEVEEVVFNHERQRDVEEDAAKIDATSYTFLLGFEAKI